MSDAARAAFEAHAEDYDAQRRRLLPCFDAFYAAAIEAVGLPGRAPGRVLDLGAGTGLLAGIVADAFPAAQLTLLDGAGAMLAQARERLGQRASYVVGDFADPLPQGPWDAIVSALAIHHLDDPGKRDLFARVRAALAPGGVFVNAEQVAGETPWLDTVLVQRHERAARALGATEAEWAAAAQRMGHDLCATVEDQLAWLRAAGFADVGCLWRDGRFAVLVAHAAA
jgi:tRNA (cmo5U34)-methyltransferase